MSAEKAGNFVLKDQFGNDFELYENLDKKILLILNRSIEGQLCRIY